MLWYMYYNDTYYYKHQIALPVNGVTTNGASGGAGLATVTLNDK